MRPVSLGIALDEADFQRWVENALREIERASHENAIAVADAFSLTGTLTETRTLDLSSPSASNVAAVLATLINDLQKRGTKRS